MTDVRTVLKLENEDLRKEIAQLREALTQANELYNAVEAMNLELTERIAQDELAFGFMREANTLLTADVKRLTAELEQCKHALDDEGEDADVCKCGHTRNVHIGAGCLAKPAPHERTKYCGCDEFELVEDACSCGHSLDSHTKSGVHPCRECECSMFWAKVTE